MKNFYNWIIKFLLKAHSFIYHEISYFAAKIAEMNNTTHPKHEIIKYFDYFLENIEKNSIVLDVGCEKGILTKKISKIARKVVGIDINTKSIKYAKENSNDDNITYILGDINNYQFNERFDYIILSNILEHIENRKELLLKMKSIGNILLIRVPMINRSWIVIYKKKMNLEYYLDKNHFIEYTLGSFTDELNSAGLKIISHSIQFGEIWAKVGISN